MPTSSIVGIGRLGLNAFANVRLANVAKLLVLVSVLVLIFSPVKKVLATRNTDIYPSSLILWYRSNSCIRCTRLLGCRSAQNTAMPDASLTLNLFPAPSMACSAKADFISWDRTSMICVGCKLNPDGVVRAKCNISFHIALGMVMFDAKRFTDVRSCTIRWKVRKRELASSTSFAAARWLFFAAAAAAVPCCSETVAIARRRRTEVLVVLIVHVGWREVKRRKSKVWTRQI